MKQIACLLCVLAVALGCAQKSEPPATQSSSATSAPATQAAAPAPAPAPASVAPAPAPTSAAPSAGALASQETNWKGVTAEVTEFRRKGNTLTAKVRLVNRGMEHIAPEIIFSGTYLIDTAGGKKYQVLKDEKDAYIASLNSGWNDRWHQDIDPGESKMIWMKFPAPPPETKAITLQIPNTPPFEDVNIQD